MTSTIPVGWNDDAGGNDDAWKWIHGLLSRTPCGHVSSMFTPSVSPSKGKQIKQKGNIKTGSEEGEYLKISEDI